MRTDLDRLYLSTRSLAVRFISELRRRVDPPPGHRSGLRQLWKHPGFSVPAIFPLTVGVAASVTVFSVLYRVLIHPFPYRDAERVVEFNFRDKLDIEETPHIYREQIGQFRAAMAEKGSDLAEVARDEIRRFRNHVDTYDDEELMQLGEIAKAGLADEKTIFQTREQVIRYLALNASTELEDLWVADATARLEALVRRIEFPDMVLRRREQMLHGQLAATLKKEDFVCYTDNEVRKFACDMRSLFLHDRSRHLAICTACQKRLEAWTKIISDFDSKIATENGRPPLRCWGSERQPFIASLRISKQRPLTQPESADKYRHLTENHFCFRVNHGGGTLLDQATDQLIVQARRRAS